MFNVFLCVIITFICGKKNRLLQALMLSCQQESKYCALFLSRATVKHSSLPCLCKTINGP